jgi:hypothetical protein
MSLSHPELSAHEKLALLGLSWIDLPETYRPSPHYNSQYRAIRSNEKGERHTKHAPIAKIIKFTPVRNTFLFDSVYRPLFRNSQKMPLIPSAHIATLATATQNSFWETHK